MRLVFEYFMLLTQNLRLFDNRVTTNYVAYGSEDANFNDGKQSSLQNQLFIDNLNRKILSLLLNFVVHVFLTVVTSGS